MIGVVLMATLAIGVSTPAVAAPQAKQLAGRGSIWVTNDGAGGDPVQVIKGKTVTFLTLPGLSNPTGIAFTPDGDYAYVANTDASNIKVISTHTLTVTSTISLPVLQSGSPAPTVVVMAPDGTTAYVSDGSFVDVISTATNTVTDSFEVGGIGGMAIAPNGQYLYATWLNGATADVAVIDTSTDKVTDDIPVGGDPQGIAITPNGETAYVSNCSGAFTCTLDTATDTVTSSFSVGPGGGGGGVAVSRSGKEVWVLDTNGTQTFAEIKPGRVNKVTPVGGLNGPRGTGTVVMTGSNSGLIACQGGGLAVVKGTSVTYPYSLGGDAQLAGVAIEP